MGVIRKRMLSVDENYMGKRMRMVVPELPWDIWYCIAKQLDVSCLYALMQTCKGLRQVSEEVLQHMVEQGGGGGGRDVTRIVEMLDRTPSLRHKGLARQFRGLCEGREGEVDMGMCFTKEQAQAFLGIEEGGLEGYEEARVGGVKRSRKRAGAVGLAAFPPDVVRGRVFGLKEVLRAAREGWGEWERGVEVVKRSVNEDKERFERAEKAERWIEEVLKGCNVEKREVEYVLGASLKVGEFRRGFWKMRFEEYGEVVREMVQVHLKLGECYRCLLICDGHARLKAKRIVGKFLKRGGWDRGGVVRALEGNLWWARSRSNVQKMEEMSRMPHIRV